MQKKVSNLFDQLSLINKTKDYHDSALHTVFSISFLENRNAIPDIQHFDKKITDHSLITVTID